MYVVCDRQLLLEQGFMTLPPLQTVASVAPKECVMSDEAATRHVVRSENGPDVLGLRFRASFVPITRQTIAIEKHRRRTNLLRQRRKHVRVGI